jgi:hypothetical protein
MTALAANRGWLIVMIVLIASLIGFFFVIFHFQSEEEHNLQKIQSVKLMNDETVKERAERIMPQGRWEAGEWGCSYRLGSRVLFWAIENDRILAASVTTIELFPELSPPIDQKTLNLIERNTPFNPFHFGRLSEK